MAFVFTYTNFLKLGLCPVSIWYLLATELSKANSCCESVYSG